MHTLDKVLREQCVILDHRLMVLDALRLAQTAREYLEAGADVMPAALLDRYEEAAAARRKRIKLMTRA